MMRILTIILIVALFGLFTVDSEAQTTFYYYPQSNNYTQYYYYGQDSYNPPVLYVIPNEGNLVTIPETFGPKWLYPSYQYRSQQNYNQLLKRYAPLPYNR